MGSYEDLEKHFDQPLVEVARKFDVCTTFFKKICRQHGIKRWPFRKLKSLQRKMKASGQMLLVPQPEKTHQVARSSPDLQWMLAARSQMGLFPPEQRPDDQQLFETRAGRVAEMIEISAGQRVATPTGQRGPVDAGHIVCWDNQADVLTEETPEDSVTNHGGRGGRRVDSGFKRNDSQDQGLSERHDKHMRILRSVYSYPKDLQVSIHSCADPPNNPLNALHTPRRSRRVHETTVEERKSVKCKLSSI